MYDDTDKDLVDRITKREVFWDFVWRYFPLAKGVHDFWRHARLRHYREGEDEVGSAGLSGFRTLWFLYRHMPHDLAQWFKELTKSSTEADEDTSQVGEDRT